MTELEFMTVPDVSERHELVAGRVLAEPFPSALHDRVCSRLERHIDEYLRTHDLGERFGYTGFVLARRPDTIRGPDLSFVTHERLGGLDELRWFEGAPDLAIEVKSPSNSRRKIEAKVRHYFGAGARLVWVVDPLRESATVYRPDQTQERLGRDDSLSGDDVLPGLVIPLAAIFVR